ncbi:clan AA aspartic protease [Marixanthomonas sp. SCSIO 43207]|uniref:retropepsin-like aspartic protease family protein n=1 Tax=Marixanthomonas sp. SCSIO 43207 TaxID=2779360 RepID=UPI001CA7C405|nr:retropepsin-like aspartic protease [Marixanthomonas sp. SCSIO 43207]UAB81725.1 clan AA aspartic protease [Marixanthomonas sp. SCSIO 43207]
MHLRTFLEEKNFHRVPLKKLATGHYKLSLKLNGVLGNFILDTGASTSCVGFTGIDHFLMTSEESQIKAAGAGAINMETKISRNNTINIGKWNTKKMDFVVFDLSHVNQALEQAEEESVHGIIGADFLKKFRAVIDYGRNCLYLK